jgi:hypothetical protein
MSRSDAVGQQQKERRMFPIHHEFWQNRRLSLSDFTCERARERNVTAEAIPYATVTIANLSVLNPNTFRGLGKAEDTRIRIDLAVPLKYAAGFPPAVALVVSHAEYQGFPALRAKVSVVNEHGDSDGNCLATVLMNTSDQF